MHVDFNTYQVWDLKLEVYSLTLIIHIDLLDVYLFNILSVCLWIFFKCFFLTLQMGVSAPGKTQCEVCKKKKKSFTMGSSKAMIPSPIVFFFLEGKESAISFSSASNCIIFRSLLCFKLYSDTKYNKKHTYFHTWDWKITKNKQKE